MLIAELSKKLEPRKKLFLNNKTLGSKLDLLQVQLEKSPDGILVTDKENRICSWNSRFQEIWKISDALLQSGNGESLLDALQNRIVSPPFFIARVKELLKTPDDIKEELDISRVGGRTLRCFSRTINDSLGVYWGRVWFYRDITDFIKSEQLREDIDQITRHELKTPLNSIISFPEILLDDANFTDEQREILKHIRDSGYRMLEMIDTSLSLYKMEKGKYEFTPSKIDIVSILYRIKSELASMLDSKGLQISIENALSKEGCSEFFVHGEELLCYSMLSNLFKNAIEASPRNETIHVHLSRESPEKHKAIAIHNWGEVPESIRHVFGQKYVTSGKKTGTGLGVYSARLMAETMGGCLTFSTSKSRGTTITVFLQ